MKLRLSIRQRVMALVAGLGALGGFPAGAAGALAAVTVLTPASPVSPGQKLAMVLAYGTIAALTGAALGTGVAFALVRRIRLGRVLVFGTLGAAVGLTYGFLGGPWAWHHFPWLGVGGLVAGALAARSAGRPSAEEAADGRLASWVLARVGAGPDHAVLGAGAMTPLRRANREAAPEAARQA